MFPSPFTDPEDWDALSDAEKRTELNAFMASKGFDPEEHQKEKRIRDLEERVRRLESDKGLLEEELRVLKQDYQTEIQQIRLNLADYAQLAVQQAMRKEFKQQQRRY